jgi:hypothetical protein
MIKRILGALAFALAFAVAFVLVKELKSSWVASSSMQEAGETASTAAGKAIRAAQSQATAGKPATEFVIEKSQKEMTATLDKETTDKTKQLVSASNFFFGAYVLNTRSRPDYCASLGVDIKSFVEAYKRQNQSVFEAAKKIQIKDSR